MSCCHCCAHSRCLLPAVLLLLLYSVPYSALSELFEKVENEPKRLKIIGLVSDFLRSVIAISPNELLACVYLCCNKVPSIALYAFGI